MSWETRVRYFTCCPLSHIICWSIWYMTLRQVLSVRTAFFFSTQKSSNWEGEIGVRALLFLLSFPSQTLIQSSTTTSLYVTTRTSWSKRRRREIKITRFFHRCWFISLDVYGLLLLMFHLNLEHCEPKTKFQMFLK